MLKTWENYQLTIIAELRSVAAECWLAEMASQAGDAVQAGEGEERGSEGSAATSEEFELVREPSSPGPMPAQSQHNVEQSLSECLAEQAETGTVINNENLVDPDPDHTIFHTVAYLGSVRSDYHCLTFQRSKLFIAACTTRVTRLRSRSTWR